jgi:hypothetical protein
LRILAGEARKLRRNSAGTRTDRCPRWVIRSCDDPDRIALYDGCGSKADQNPSRFPGTRAATPRSKARSDTSAAHVGSLPRSIPRAGRQRARGLPALLPARPQEWVVAALCRWGARPWWSPRTPRSTFTRLNSWSRTGQWAIYRGLTQLPRHARAGLAALRGLRCRTVAREG